MLKNCIKTSSETNELLNNYLKRIEEYFFTSNSLKFSDASENHQEHKINQSVFQVFNYLTMKAPIIFVDSNQNNEEFGFDKKTKRLVIFPQKNTETLVVEMLLGYVDMLINQDINFALYSSKKKKLLCYMTTFFLLSSTKYESYLLEFFNTNDLETSNINSLLIEDSFTLFSKVDINFV